MKQATPLIVIAALLVVAAIVVIPMMNRAEPDAGQEIAIVGHAAPGELVPALRRGAERALEGTGLKVSCEGPAAQQADTGKLVEKCIARRVSGVVFASCETADLPGLVEKLSDANIPCVAVGPFVDSQGLAASFETNGYIAGLVAARRIGRILGGSGTVAVLKEASASGLTLDCENGFLDTLKREFPGIRAVVAGYRADALAGSAEAVKGLLANTPGVKGLFAPSQAAALAGLKAVEGAGLGGEVKVVAFGWGQALIDAVKSGSIDALVTVDLEELGYKAAQALVAAIEGRQVDGFARAEPVLLTRDNVETAARPAATAVSH